MEPKMSSAKQEGTKLTQELDYDLRLGKIIHLDVSQTTNQLQGPEEQETNIPHNLLRLLSPMLVRSRRSREENVEKKILCRVDLGGGGNEREQCDLETKKQDIINNVMQSSNHE